MNLSTCGHDSMNVVGCITADTAGLYIVTLTSVENNETAIDLYCMSLVGKHVSMAFLSAYPLGLSFEETIP